MRSLISAQLKLEASISMPKTWRDLSDKDTSTNIYQQNVIPSAVLVPLIERSMGIRIILTRRSKYLKSHGGQISFPGGRMEKEDISPAHTALRETQEEIGIDTDAVEIIGCLDNYSIVTTGFRITPLVGFVNPTQKFKRNESEVESIFEIPLTVVMNKKNYHKESRTIKDVNYSYQVLPYEEHRIWGATAAILLNLCNLLSK